MSALYTAEVTSSGDGRSGRVRASDGLIDTALAAPREIGGPGGATNPEQLFAAGYAACFHSALRIAARKQRATLVGDTVTARIGLGQDPDGYLLSAELSVHLPGVPAEQAHSLVQQAHQLCPYSRAVRGNVAVALRVTS
ncbi:organic hydroperoxide resistance protein [Kutzneria viridogrisea]|uniref:Organic hydroperoxide resistance protein n=2 Tax=Kutzneria TaxID=43356 RepID=W5WSM8_9PSEU|nr:organic hydroperoxide resistance protein [Kutzneria albida]AHI01140.1 hypothetical protein KALB_7782 [Kutzneria albida DSM 43870]MBA8926395.1 Ohr subfamily peroxiredoxin [Kutzneria viridogrisea]